MMESDAIALKEHLFTNFMRKMKDTSVLFRGLHFEFVPGQLDIAQQNNIRTYITDCGGVMFKKVFSREPIKVKSKAEGKESNRENFSYKSANRGDVEMLEEGKNEQSFVEEAKESKREMKVVALGKVCRNI